MELILTVTSANKGNLGADATKTFGVTGGTIGRAWDNTWVLPDPERYISSKHARIECENGAFFLTDTSSNGVVLAASDSVIGRGNRISIEDGQEFFIGDYKVMAAFGSAHDALAAHPSPQDQFASMPVVDSGAAMDEFIGISQDPLELLNGQSAADQSPASLSQVLNADSSASDLMQSIGFEEPASNLIQGAGSQPQSQSLGHKPAFNEPMNFAPREAAQTSSAAANNEIPDDWDVTGFSVPEPKPAPVQAPSPASDHAPTSSQNVDDFFSMSEEEFFGGQPAAQTSIPVAATPDIQSNLDDITSPPASIDTMGMADSSDLMNLLSSEDSPEAAVTASAQVAQELPGDTEKAIVHSDPVPAPQNAPELIEQPAAQTGFSASETAQRIAAGRQGNNTRNHQQAPTADSSSLLAKAKESLTEQGIDPNILTQEVAEQWLALMPTIMDGVTQLILARAHIKNEFRVNKTILHAQENNPLKFSANGADAINNLFVHQRPGFLSPQAALEQAFKDIGIHQTALLHGLQQSMTELLDNFDPDTLQTQFDQGQKKSGLLSMMGHSKYWQLYIERFQDFKIDSDDDFQRIFGATFAKAYDNHCTAHGQSD